MTLSGTTIGWMVRGLARTFVMLVCLFLAIEGLLLMSIGIQDYVNPGFTQEWYWSIAGTNLAIGFTVFLVGYTWGWSLILYWLRRPENWKRNIGRAFATALLIAGISSLAAWQTLPLVDRPPHALLQVATELLWMGSIELFLAAVCFVTSGNR